MMLCHDFPGTYGEIGSRICHQSASLINKTREKASTLHLSDRMCEGVFGDVRRLGGRRAQIPERDLNP